MLCWQIHGVPGASLGAWLDRSGPGNLLTPGGSSGGDTNTTPGKTTKNETRSNKDKNDNWSSINNEEKTTVVCVLRQITMNKEEPKKKRKSDKNKNNRLFLDSEEPQKKHLRNKIRCPDVEGEASEQQLKWITEELLGGRIQHPQTPESCSGCKHLQNPATAWHPLYQRHVFKLKLQKLFPSYFCSCQHVHLVNILHWLT